MGRFIIFTGFLVVILGIIIHFKIQIPWLTGWIGRLPGDLVIKKGTVIIYLPLATSVFFSLILSFACSLFKK